MGSKALPQRKPARLPGYDYASPGAYFITVSTYRSEPLFGEILGETMRLNPFGKIVQHAWEDLPHHYPHVRLGAFIVMPNHVHGIVILEAEPDFSSPDECTGTGRSQTVPYPYGKPRPHSQGTKRHGLPEIVRAFKSFSSRRINELRGTPGVRVWHRSYYDRIIRNEREWARIRAYILDNPRRWAEDRFAPGQDSAPVRNIVRDSLRPSRTEEKERKEQEQDPRAAHRNLEEPGYGE